MQRVRPPARPAEPARKSASSTNAPAVRTPAAWAHRVECAPWRGYLPRGRDMAATRNEILTLHRYFIWANRMRVHLEDVLGRDVRGKTLAELESLQRAMQDGRWSQSGDDEIETMLYMSYWYAALYVVIDGWRDLKLTDVAIDGLLSSPNVGLLKRYRHGVFHYQRRYFDERFLGFIRDGQDAVAWVRTLNREFGRFFLEWAERDRARMS
jgi:hypothetical protein